MSHDHVTEEGVVYIARALKAKFPILSLLLYSLLQHQSQVREFPPSLLSLSHKRLAGTLPATCMSIGPYPTPFSSTAPIPLQPFQDVRDQLWSYRLQRSLETNWSHPPFSTLDAGFTAPPFLISALHYFEWRSEVHHYPLIIVQIHISPAFSFNTPVVHIVHSPQYSCPSLHILWWDLPTTLPLVALDYLQEYDSLSSDNVDLFISQLDDFHTCYFGPITPYDRVTSSLRPPRALALPHTPANPYTIPLVSHK